MTTRSQERNAVEVLDFQDIEASITKNIQDENIILGPRLHSEIFNEFKMSLRKETISDLTKLVAENQKEMLKLLVPKCNRNGHRGESSLDMVT